MLKTSVGTEVQVITGGLKGDFHQTGKYSLFSYSFKVIKVSNVDHFRQPKQLNILLT